MHTYIHMDRATVMSPQLTKYIGKTRVLMVTTVRRGKKTDARFQSRDGAAENENNDTSPKRFY